MRNIFRSASLTVALAFVPLGSPASAQSYRQDRGSGQFDVSIFYDGLSPYGDWVEMPDYGWSFAPRVNRDWRPYTRGQWVWTDYGWYWDSDEDFGWAAYHYGRWVNDRYYGWVWVPGTEWAPAWVSWRHGHGYTGWAPLPPRARWQARVGLNIGGLQIDAYLGARDYNFVPDRSFVDRGLYQQVLPATQNITIINETTNVTNYTVVNQRIVNGGIPVTNIEQAVGRSVPRARTVEATSADAPRRAAAGEVAVYRPSVKAAPERRPAQGRSLVKGEEAPPLLVERRKQRDEERQQSGNRPDPTARDAAQQRPAPVTPAARPADVAPAPQTQQPHGRPAPTRPPAIEQETQQQRDQANRAQEQKAQQQRDQANQAQQQKAQQQQRDQANRMQDQKAQQQQRDQANQAQQQKAQQQQRDQENQAQQQKAQQQQRDQENQAQQQKAQQQQRDQENQAQQQKAQQQQRDQANQAQQQKAQQQKAQQEQRAKPEPPPAAKPANPQPPAKGKGNKKDPKPTPTPGPSDKQ